MEKNIRLLNNLKWGCAGIGIRGGPKHRYIVGSNPTVPTIWCRCPRWTSRLISGQQQVQLLSVPPICRVLWIGQTFHKRLRTVQFCHAVPFNMSRQSSDLRPRPAKPPDPYANMGVGLNPTLDSTTEATKDVPETAARQRGGERTIKSGGLGAPSQDVKEYGLIR